jgi:transcriptional regulator with XRE-family HTH domain
MNQFTRKLAELMKLNQLRAAELSRATKIDQATISRWLNGVQDSITDDDLKNLAGHISPHAEERAQLIAARMRDVCNGPGSELIEVRIGGSELRETPSVYKNKLPELPVALEHAIHVFAQNWRETDVRNAVTGLASVLETGDARIEKSAGGLRPETYPAHKAQGDEMNDKKNGKKKS